MFDLWFVHKIMLIKCGLHHFLIDAHKYLYYRRWLTVTYAILFQVPTTDDISSKLQLHAMLPEVDCYDWACNTLEGLIDKSVDTAKLIFVNR